MNRIYKAIAESSASELMHLADSLFLHYNLSLASQTTDPDYVSAGDIMEFLLETAKDEIQQISVPTYLEGSI